MDTHMCINTYTYTHVHTHTHTHSWTQTPLIDMGDHSFESNCAIRRNPEDASISMFAKHKVRVCKAQGTCLQRTRYMFASTRYMFAKHKVHVCKAQGTPCQFNIEPTCKFCALMKSACVLQTCFNNLQHARKWSRSSATWLRTAFDIWHATWGLTYLTYQSVRNRWVHAVRLWQHTVLAPLWRTHTHAYTCIHTTRAHEHGF
jgi:hypothetical protein